MSFPILTLLVLLPVVGSVLTSLISNRQPDLVKVTALLTSAATGRIEPPYARFLKLVIPRVVKVHSFACRAF